MAKQSKIINQRDVQLTLDKTSKGLPFKVTGDRVVRDLNANTASIGNLADCVVTLIKELQAKGIING